MFYEKLRENRIKLNLSIEELADKLKVSKQIVSKWETGVSMPDLENVIKLSELFKVSTDYLLKDRKSLSDFSYYTVVQEEKKNISPFKLLNILAFVLIVMGLITLFVVTIVEPLNFITESGKEFSGFLAYCFIYPEFFIVIILLIAALILSILVILLPDEKRRVMFKRKTVKK
ncbi:MAG: helix-turn-helix transcriptional regulator [Tenericutes bacterium]|nr:helix-turn-helix transcriptional regulator [Mycoplasmatota bacterium]